MKLSATHTFNCIVLLVKFGWTSCEDIPPALLCIYKHTYIHTHTHTHTHTNTYTHIYIYDCLNKNPPNSHLPVFWGNIILNFNLKKASLALVLDLFSEHNNTWLTTVLQESLVGGKFGEIGESSLIRQTI